MRRLLLSMLVFATGCVTAAPRRSSVGRESKEIARPSTPSELGRELSPEESPIALERPIKSFGGARGTEARPPVQLAEPLVPRERTRAIVLMFHSIDKSDSVRTVWPWDFEAHIQRLRDHHIEIIHLSQLVGFLYGDIERLPARVAVITIDDGEVLFHKYAWPILKRQKAPFTLGIITRPTELAEHAHALSWDHLTEMLGSGLCEIASHGHMHLSSTALKDDELDFELNHSRALIGAHTGFVPQAFIYPLGAFDERVVERVRNARYRAAFTAVGHPVGADASPYRIPRFKMQRGTAYNAVTRFFEREHRAP